MEMLNILAILISLSAIFAYVNHRFLKLPMAIGLMLIALLMSFGLIIVDQLGMQVLDPVKEMLARLDFNFSLMHGMLSFLLFAGALHVNINDLTKNKWIITALATIGIVISTLVVGYVTWWVLGKFGIEMPLMYCLLFGALISPTDPIAVLGILRSAGAPKNLETKITGESLFNDGVGVVVFLVIFGIAVDGQPATIASIGGLLLQEVVGGVLFGLVVGGLAYSLLKSIDCYQVEVLITLAVVVGGYALAHALHVSGPIAVVVSGLLIGNHGRLLAMSEKSREHIDTFWELVDEILNAVLFVLIGLEVVVLVVSTQYLVAAIFIIPIVLFARFVSVSIPVTVLRLKREFTPHAIKVMTWGGLRGGISIALALSLPVGGERDLILLITYVVVAFSILVQGLTIGKLIKSGGEIS